MLTKIYMHDTMVTDSKETKKYRKGDGKNE